MRSPIDVLRGRIDGLEKSAIVRRTVPCYKYVQESEGERLALCLLVDSQYLYRFPFENSKGTKSLSLKGRFLKGEMDHLRLREFQPGHCRYVQPQSSRRSA
jgi:hypothetical protein